MNSGEHAHQRRASGSWPLPEPRVVVTVEVDAASAELVADQCFVLGASAVGERELAHGQVELTADFASDRVDEVLASIRGARRADLVPLDSSAWRDHLEPFTVGDVLTIRPPWRTPSSVASAVELIIDPGEAFGSGTHPTTRGCLDQLCRMSQSSRLVGASVLDVGCGCGVLGLAALALGAGHLTAVDIDPLAVDATNANAAANGAEDRTSVLLGSVDALPAGTFDLVVANLLAPVFDDLGAALADRVGTGGSLVASGILESQEQRVRDQLGGFELVDRRLLGDWQVLEFRRS